MSATVADQKQFTNSEGYFVIDVAKFKAIGTWMLLQWEESTDEIRAGKLKLLRPATFKKQHYTGVILKIGTQVDPVLEIGQRVFFEQFAGIQKAFDPKYGRLAIIRDSWTIAILPARVKVESMDGDYDYGQ